MLRVYYKCSCMQDEGSFQMEPRGVHEDISDFMDRLTVKLSIDHRARNPICVAEKVEYVKMRLPGEGEPVGSV